MSVIFNKSKAETNNFCVAKTPILSPKNGLSVDHMATQPTSPKTQSISGLERGVTNALPTLEYPTKNDGNANDEKVQLNASIHSELKFPKNSSGHHA